MESKNLSWKELSQHKAPKTASVAHASWAVLGGSFINFEPILPSIYELPLDAGSQFNPITGEFTCDKHYFLLISVQRLSSARNEASQKIFIEFKNESVAGPNYSVRCDINEFFGDLRHCLEEGNTPFDVKKHEEYDMTRNFVAKVVQAEKMPKRTAKVGISKLRLLIPRARNGRLTRDQWRAFLVKDGIFTRRWDPKVFAEFCKERQREYDEAKALKEKAEEEEEKMIGVNSFARLFKVMKGTKIRLVLDHKSTQANRPNVADNSIEGSNEVILWSLAVVQEAFISENDAAKLKEQKSFVNCQQPYCCFKCGKRVKTTSGFVQHFRSHGIDTTPPNVQKKIKNVPCSVQGCTKKFTTKEAMRDHVKFYRHAKCTTCHKRVKDELALQMHNITKHTHLMDRHHLHKYYIYRYMIYSRAGKVCNLCRAAFPQPDDKLRHMNDYKHYQCTICCKSFMTEGNLQRHVQCKHPHYYKQHLLEAPNKKAKRLAHMTKADVDDES